jgi:hypothetical protein
LADKAQLTHIFIAIDSIASRAHSMSANEPFFLIKADICAAYASHLGGLANEIAIEGVELICRQDLSLKSLEGF